MESTAVRSERRGRKRRRKDGEDSVPADQGIAQQVKKRVVDRRPVPLVGRYVRKAFASSGVFLGKIVYYDSGLYRIDYEDGDCEDLESSEIRGILIRDGDFDGEMMERRRRLDETILSKEVKSTKEAKPVASGNVLERTEVSSLSEVSSDPSHEPGGAQVDVSSDSSTDSCEYVQDGDSCLNAEVCFVPPPELPASSGTIGIPEEYVSHLFSVYSFLRSFGIRLFLCPFGLDDFVGSLNCVVQNTLLGAIHVALLRALKRHLEMLSSDGSELAVKCLRGIDWSLLDTLTWPVFVVYYITAAGHAKASEWKGFYTDVLGKEYYNLSAGRKLIILQILCDDVLDSAELRAEIDMREESEVGIDSDDILTNQTENGPRRVHPKYPKTSAFKGQEAVDIIAESQKTNQACSLNSIASEGTELDSSAADVELDGNGDECRLCGMDGTLLCCDGCPSAYHSRCIGVNKLSIPDGSWFCPECIFNKTGPAVTKGTSLGAAEIFGVDSYGQVFLGTCNHLLVLKASVNEDSCQRYYNQNDIIKVLEALISSMQHRALYLGICKVILRYWEIPENVLPFAEIIDSHTTFANQKDDTKPSTLLLPPGWKADGGFNTIETDANVIKVENATALLPETSVTALADHTVLEQTADSKSEQSIVHPQQLKVEVNNSTSSATHRTNSSDISLRSSAERSSLKDYAALGIPSARMGGHVNGISLLENNTPSKEVSLGVGGKFARNSNNDRPYMGSFFKPNAYFNHYIHGDFAASAAANLAVLSSEENRISEAYAMENSRKILAADVMLQMKAFSSVAIRFCWPNCEKRVAEIPRERCGWCLSCKAPPTSKKTCLINSAALGAVRGAMKILAGICPVKNGEGSVLNSIATYILYMEESLRGLVAGPFLSASFRKQWRKRLEQASSCGMLKALLLELEENIHYIAFSSDWLKLVDNCSDESSVAHSTTCTTGSYQKRGPSGRRGRKQSTISEVNDDDCSDKLNDFSWWRGGKISKFVYQRGVLPHKMLKRAAFQGGSRKIFGVFYAEGFEIPRRSRQTVWRAAVGMSHNASQLALQVRYLDLHIRWNNLARPEQNILEKGPETEASAFRNAFICDKIIVENKVKYGVAFGNQRHLPSRVLKSIIEVETSEDGKEKYWFFETRIPLYLIKEYEEKATKASLPVEENSSPVLSVMQRRQLKASRRDIFSYLVRKRNNMDHCSCTACPLSVLLRDAVTCSVCEGYCHPKCTIKSAADASEEVGSIITCKQCYFAGGLTQDECTNESPTSPLPSQVQEHQSSVIVSKSAKQKNSSQAVAVPKTLETCGEAKSALDSSVTTKIRRGICSWGLIWKKKKKDNDDSGFSFRVKNIVMKGNSNSNGLKPICHLCRKPYNPDLMYIRCENCSNWYHADAVELKESKIFDLLGFKCCKCRRIRSPVCPYMDPAMIKPEVKRTRQKASKVSAGDDSGLGFVSGQFMEQKPTKVLPKVEEFVQDVSLPSSILRVQQLVGHDAEANFECDTSAQGPRKLQVRRQVKHDDHASHAEIGPILAQSSTTEIANLINVDGVSSPVSGLDASINSVENETLDYDINYEDMEFEPQTYFSFTELLASDDGGEMDEVDPTVVLSENLQNVASTMSVDEIPGHALAACSGQQDALIPAEPDVNVALCGICLQIDPAPDRLCQICELLIHSSCSPWVEPSSFEDDWRCGRCREWR